MSIWHKSNQDVRFSQTKLALIFRNHANMQNIGVKARKYVKVYAKPSL